MKTSSLIIWVFIVAQILLFNSFTGYAQPSLFSLEKFVSGQDTLNYRFLFPDYNTMRELPLVVFLHGSGERGNDNEAQLKWGVKNFATSEQMKMHSSFVVAPQCPSGESWANFLFDETSGSIQMQDIPTKPMELLVQLIEQLIKDYSVDTRRIYITGLSMGGLGTFDAMARYPDLFAAAVPVCGGGDPTTAPLIKDIPIWIFHGAEDTSVDPQYSVDMLQALIDVGAHPGLTYYPEVGHFSWIAAYSDPLMIEWLFRQKKKQ
ncbi:MULTISPECIES: prolyl oligopeptidase family serine peptidase [unclassified Lentimicrobium]|uniref:carboxylesterase family protein n=1 Tax=unclassified Lentimicrobium TaxID=2677434 RepID=UPI0015570638|nr:MULTISPECIES: prolyl oligopeptidase family serine peptidase [unclassified Lentimicrobium]NPD45668.1 prolyl oligopeptidase family serine peptidase [Lentimicrobium sp. S6]NPD85547.1 prolyl oligopeptidase family serine peptidase [Lentimicrobium sp. L6]